jgi:hypothetical protein
MTVACPLETKPSVTPTAAEMAATLLHPPIALVMAGPSSSATPDQTSRDVGRNKEILPPIRGRSDQGHRLGPGGVQRFRPGWQGNQKQGGKNLPKPLLLYLSCIIGAGAPVRTVLPTLSAPAVCGSAKFKSKPEYLLAARRRRIKLNCIPASYGGADVDK